MSCKQVQSVDFGLTPRVLDITLFMSASAFSTVMSGMDDVLVETRGKMTLQVTLEFLNVAPSHSPVE